MNRTSIFHLMQNRVPFAWSTICHLYTMQEQHILQIFNSSWLLYIFRYTFNWTFWEVTPDVGHPNNYRFFQSNTASRIQNNIGCDLFWTRFKFFTPKSPLIIKPVDVRFDCFLLPIPESLTNAKLRDFSVFAKSDMENIKENTLYRRLIVFYSIDFFFLRCVIVLKLISMVIYFKRFFHMVLYINIISSNSLIVRHKCPWADVCAI